MCLKSAVLRYFISLVKFYVWVHEDQDDVSVELVLGVIFVGCNGRLKSIPPVLAQPDWWCDRKETRGTGTEGIDQGQQA